MTAVALALLTFATQLIVPHTKGTLGPLPWIQFRVSDGPSGVLDYLDLFVVLDRERVAFITWYSREIQIADRKGKVVQRIGAHLSIDKLIRLGPDRLLYATREGLDPLTGKLHVLWTADIGSNSVQPFGALSRGDILELIALGDGGCAALTIERHENAPNQEVLQAFDATGAERFAVQVPVFGRDLFESHDGRIGLVHHDESARIMWFDRDGRDAGTTELETTENQGDGYVGPLISCPDGSLFAQYVDRAERIGPVLRRFDDRGHKVRDVPLRFAEPTTSPRRCCFQGPDHLPWIYDGFAFLRFGLDGVCTTEFAEPGDADRLRAASRAVVDPEGDVYALSLRDHVVHVFDAGGRRLDRIAPLNPENLPALAFRWDQAGAPFSPAEFAWIARGWLGPEHAGLHFEQTRGNTPWQVALLDEHGHVARTLDPPNVPDRWWVAAPSRTAGDGSIAVVWRSTDKSPRRSIAMWYDETGAVRGAFSLPMDARHAYVAAWDGRRLAIADYLRVWLLDARGRVLADRWLSDRRDYPESFAGCGSGGDTTPYLDFGAHGCELWMHHGFGSTMFQRFEIP